MNNLVFTRKISTQTKWLTLLTVLPLYIFGGSLIGNAILKFSIIHFSLKADANTLNAILNLIVDFFMMLYVIWIFKDSLIKQWKDFKKNIAQNIFYGLLIGEAMLYGVGIVGGLITLLLGGDQTSVNQEFISKITIAHPMIMMITTVVFAPVLEEIVFRGLVFSWLYEWHPKVAHFISSLFFGFVHVMLAMMSGNVGEWVQIFAYFFKGFVLSYLYEKRNNIFVPMLTHCVNNLISMIIILYIGG